ncbi:MAG: hypothetical protein AAB553_01935 [Patescibacteria group bacterium]
MNVEKIGITPTKKTKQGLWNLFIEQVSLPEGFTPVTHSLVSIPPSEVGGNHKHPRREIFLAVTDGLVLVWKDETGKREEKMGPTEGHGLTLFSLPPYIPHAVVNRGKIPAIMYEWADAKQHDVERVHLIEVER